MRSRCEVNTRASRGPRLKVGLKAPVYQNGFRCTPEGSEGSQEQEMFMIMLFSIGKMDGFQLGYRIKGHIT